MADNSQRSKGQDEILSALNVAIKGLNITKEAASTIPVNHVFGSVATLLETIRVSTLLFCEEIFHVHHLQDTMLYDQNYVDLGLSCADACRALERGMGEKELKDLSESVRDAINLLTT